MESATEETVKFIIDAFKDWPENVAALVKIVAVELGYLVDIAALKAEDIADAMNPKNGSIAVTWKKSTTNWPKLSPVETGCYPPA